MPNLEWEVPHAIISPLGELDLNVPDTGTGYWYLIQPDTYKIVPSMRVTEDHVSQQSGSVVHTRYTSGLVATMTVEYVIAVGGTSPDNVPACGADLRLMHEGLMKHLDALLTVSVDPNGEQQLLWVPTGFGGNRGLAAVQTLGWPEPTWLNPGWSVTFSLECPLPYATDLGADINTPVADGDVETIANDGSAPYFPVLQVNGPTSAFTVVLGDFVLNYSGTSIPNGHYVEINMFDGTCYLDGDPTSIDLIAGIDPLSTDFFSIPVGGADIRIDAASMNVVSNNAYA